ncbi:ectoine hydroxylase [Streptomyces laurentii]|uniref:Ectoine hydroxylase n=1 Tax=Streptomyces laurentii TaxID=39478 RepID=A0A169PPS6_STRLU|nr:ectoine hydroxylase [Streptomyces laurentii]
MTADEVVTLRTELDRLVTDPAVRQDERAIVEPHSREIRSVFEVHRFSEVFAALAADPRVAGRARQILGSDVYVHQSRVNVKPGFGASGFYWHSDFETWHAEDGLPQMRTVSVSIALTANYATNGSLMIMPGSHRTFLGCAGATPKDNYKQSLQMQDAGTPSHEALGTFADACGIRQFTGPAGSATWFDCNAMHGSGDNITPYPRSNVFFVFNSVENRPEAPFAAPVRRPSFIASREFTPVG